MKNSDEKQVVFVCTGNTCRSPMAEAIFRYEAKRRNLPVIVSSAGLEAAKSGGMNLSSLRTLQAHGFSIENFVPTQLTDALLENAYAVVCMTDAQKEDLLRYAQERAFRDIEKIYAFSDFCGVSISDPYGLGMDAYESTYLTLEKWIPALIDELFKQ